MYGVLVFEWGAGTVGVIFLGVLRVEEMAMMSP